MARPKPSPIPERTGKYSARPAVLGILAEPGWEVLAEPLWHVLADGSPHDTTWTVTVRRRGRSSKSISTTCCQVPSASRPSTIGIVSDGPITAARR